MCSAYSYVSIVCGSTACRASGIAEKASPELFLVFMRRSPATHLMRGSKSRSFCGSAIRVHHKKTEGTSMCQRSESVCAAILAPKELQQKLQRHDHVLSTKLSTNSEMKASLKGLCGTVQIHSTAS